jgi:hypothetical protein
MLPIQHVKPTKIVINNNPYCSIPSLIGYKLMLFTAEHLILDIHARKNKYIECTFPFDGTTAIQIRKRETHYGYDPLSISRRDASRNVIGIYAKEHVNTQYNGTTGYTRVTNSNSIPAATTYTAWSSPDQPPLEDKRLYLWSSYRTSVLNNTR